MNGYQPVKNICIYGDDEVKNCVSTFRKRNSYEMGKIVSKTKTDRFVIRLPIKSHCHIDETVQFSGNSIEMNQFNDERTTTPKKGSRINKENKIRS